MNTYLRDDGWILRPGQLVHRQKARNAAALRGLRAIGVIIVIGRAGDGWSCSLIYRFNDEDQGVIQFCKSDQGDAIAHAVTAFEARNEV